jgi:hypothetical protein
MNTTAKFFMIAVVALFSLESRSQAVAEVTSVDTAIGGFAQKVSSACKRHNATKLVLRFQSPTFTGVTVHNVAAIGAGQENLTRLIQEEMKKLGMPAIVAVNAEHQVNASAMFKALESEELPSNDAKALKAFIFTITGELVDANGKVLETIAEEVSDADSLATLFPTNLDVTGGDSDELIDAVVEGLAAEPYVSNRTVFATKESKYGMQVLVGGKPIDVRIEDGFAFVDLKENDAFEVRAINHGDREVASELYLDGIHSSHYRNAHFYRILAPGVSADYKGWDTTEAKFYQFKITPFEKSIAAQLKQMSDVGTIQVTFREAFPKGTRPAAQTRPTLGVGAGELGEGPARKVVERDYGSLLSSVVVRFIR